MTLTMASFRGHAAPGALPQPEEKLAALESQQAEVAKQIVAVNKAKQLANRLPLAQEYKTLTMPDCPRLRELEGKMKDCGDPEALLLYRKEYNVLNAERMGQSLAITKRQGEVKLQLLQSAPPESGEQIARLDGEIATAIGAYKYSSGGGVPGEPVVQVSNRESIDSFCAAAKLAQTKLQELKFLAIDGAELQKAIGKILKTVPALNLTPIEVA